MADKLSATFGQKRLRSSLTKSLIEELSYTNKQSRSLRMTIRLIFSSEFYQSSIVFRSKRWN